MNKRRQHKGRWPGLRAWTMTAILTSCIGGPAFAADARRKPLPLTRPGPRQPLSVVPSPLLPGAPVPWTGSPVLTPLTVSIVDGETRFLAAGQAQDRCPAEPVLFVPGIVNPFRSTLPGDGAFMCRRDAIAQGFTGP